MEYPITLARDTNGTVLVSFVDFPEAHTFGDDILDALRRAPDALATVIDAYIKDRRDLPLPRQAVQRHLGDAELLCRLTQGQEFFHFSVSLVRA